MKSTNQYSQSSVDAKPLDDKSLEMVSGGPDTYIKFDGVDGESRPVDPFRNFNFTVDWGGR